MLIGAPDLKVSPQAVEYSLVIRKPDIAVDLVLTFVYLIHHAMISIDFTLFSE